ncbi:peptide MFS transporter [Prosthecobacter sp.]|uniref:peptide MFS transporter n=1 Tax=Prosthecobacter sp. TaxID=1965333 RepID=UPI0025FC1229|nr:peptide MFS transporter [Prosthecobacter sp.]
MTSESTRHPRGIRTLFFTEMWERWSYYGMRALMVPFMTAASGGLGLEKKQAMAIYGLYIATVYASALPGGWMGDRLLGTKRAVWWGGVGIALGHLVLAIHHPTAFYLGLLVIALGSGLLKSNMSTLVGLIYPEGGQRRDAGFTLFYLGINLGAFLGPLVSGWLQQSATWGWRWAFASATAGMFLGLTQWQLTRKHLEGVGDRIDHPNQNLKREWIALWAAMGGLVVVTLLCVQGVIVLDPVALAHWVTAAILIAAVFFFVWLFLYGRMDADEKARTWLIIMLFFVSALFWAGFEQMGSSFNVFAEDHTIRELGSWTIPTAWFQSINPLFVMMFSPVVALLWQRMDRRGISPTMTTKMGWAMLLLALGFGLAVVASHRAIAVGKVWPLWLLGIYFCHTIGELFLSPVGLSAVTKLSPLRHTGQMMGVWFLGTSLGDVLSGIIAGEVSGDAMHAMPVIFVRVVWISSVTGALLLIFARPLQKLARGVR